MKILSSAVYFSVIPYAVAARGLQHGLHSHDSDASPLRGSRSLVASAMAPGWVVDLTKDVKFKDKKGKLKDGVRCATPHKTNSNSPDRQLHHVDRHFSGERKLAGDMIEIETAVHVICDGPSCAADETMVTNQIRVLNQAYSDNDTGFSFNLKTTTFTENSEWYNVEPGSNAEVDMKKELADAPESTFNVYVANLGGYILGWSSFPGMYDGDTIFMDGVVVLGGSMPGGWAEPYDGGATLIHESGHYLGLRHTFEGGCNRGDLVDDTPAEKSAAFGCPLDRDTCTSRRYPGEDPIHNYMDYTDDECMDEFTKGQTERMLDQVAKYRPNLIPGSSGIQPSCIKTGYSCTTTAECCDGKCMESGRWSGTCH